ncbi:MAG: ketopantoate reductase family protein [Promethearchaeota archaeon]
MKIAIMGAGAIGSLFGGLLSKSGEDVTLVGRPKHVNAINDNGLKIEGVSGEHIIKVKATSDPADLDMVDLILLTVKAYDVEKAVVDINSIIEPETSILCLQNGLGIVDIISKTIKTNQIIRGTTTNGALFLKPGHIKHTGKGDTIIGRMTGEVDNKLEMIKAIFDKAGFLTTISTSINEILWNKLMINISINPFGALTGLPNGRLREFFEDSMKTVIEEAVEIANGVGIEIDLNKALDKTFNVQFNTKNNLNSMLQDVQRKKKTEIDFINGIIVKYGKILKIATPLNSLLTSLIHGLEQSYS